MLSNKLLELAAYRLSMRAHSPSNASELSHREATFSKAGYQDWRQSELVSQYAKNFDANLLQGKRVLDFGCGFGGLSFLAAQSGASQVIGTELSQADAAEADRRRSERGIDTVAFRHEPDPTSISLENQSVDVILCFDVMEHIMEYERILCEWRRVLTADGRILIWWSVYWHPYGHHLHTMIPLPWVHALLGYDGLMRVCAQIYDSPQFRPRIWHFDGEGNRKPNPYRGVTEPSDLNCLTIRKFERAAAKAGLAISRRDIQPFTGNRLGRLKRGLARVLPDFFCSCVVYELTAA